MPLHCENCGNPVDKFFPSDTLKKYDWCQKCVMDNLPYRRKRKKLELCPDCEDEVPTLVGWQDKDDKPHKTCEACRVKGSKETARHNAEARQAFRQEAERDMAAERDV